MTAQDMAGYCSGNHHSLAGCCDGLDCSDILDYSGSYHYAGIPALGDSGRSELHLMSEDHRSNH